MTRIYNPEEFGIFSFLISIAVIIASISTGKYEVAIMLPKRKIDVLYVFILSMIIVSVVSIVLLFIILLVYYVFYNFEIIQNIGLWLFTLPFIIFLISLNTFLNYLNNKYKFYNKLRDATIIKALSLSFFQIILGYLKKGVLGLIIGYLISIIISNIVLIRHLINKKFFNFKLDKNKIIFTSKKYIKFPLHLMPSSFSRITSSNLTILLLPIIF